MQGATYFSSSKRAPFAWPEQRKSSALLRETATGGRSALPGRGHEGPGDDPQRRHRFNLSPRSLGPHQQSDEGPGCPGQVHPHGGTGLRKRKKLAGVGIVVADKRTVRSRVGRGAESAGHQGVREKSLGFPRRRLAVDTHALLLDDESRTAVALAFR